MKVCALALIIVRLLLESCLMVLFDEIRFSASPFLFFFLGSGLVSVRVWNRYFNFIMVLVVDVDDSSLSLTEVMGKLAATLIACRSPSVRI